MSTAAFLLPLTVAADSRVQTGAANAALSASAHVNFKIVIPQVLSLRVGDANDRVLGAETVAIMSSGRTVSLNATAGKPDSNDIRARGNVILSAAARKGIAQDAQCRPGNSRARPVVCTVSMP